MTRARTAFQWKDVSAERPSTPARAGVAVIEGGVISFIRADHIGRPVFATNTAGTKVWSATYQPFGGVHVSTGTLPTNRFPGQWFQSESGLYQNWMRDYDPTTGRYLQADPLGLIDGVSVYGYVHQSPMMLTDPTGECPMCAWLLLGAAEGVAIGYLLDLAIGDGCYTWEEFWFDATFGAILGPLGNYGKALKGARAGANWKGFASFLADEGGAASAKGAAKAGAKAEGAAAHNHHPIPKFMGGNAKQPLVPVAPGLHTGAGGFHSQLDQALRNAFGRGGGGPGGSAKAWADYFAANPGAQRRAFDILLDVSRSFDAAHGTSVTSGVWNSVVSEAFRSIP